MRGRLGTAAVEPRAMRHPAVFCRRPRFFLVFLIVAVAQAAAVSPRAHTHPAAADGRDPTRGRGGGRVSRRPVFFPSLAWPSCPPPSIPSSRGAALSAAPRAGRKTPERVSRQPAPPLSEGCRGWRGLPLPPQPRLPLPAPALASTAWRGTNERTWTAIADRVSGTQVGGWRRGTATELLLHAVGPPGLPTLSAAPPPAGAPAGTRTALSRPGRGWSSRLVRSRRHSKV